VPDRERFAEIRTRCNGMLDPDIYLRLYELAAACGGAIVEVGAAHGAGTVALALGLKESGLNGRIYSFEKMTGGSRDRFGSFDDNLSIIRNNLTNYGVEDRVELLVGGVEKLHDKVPTDAPIELLVLDADGWIDRDFSLFFDRMSPNATIVIDDCEDRTPVRLLASGECEIQTKYRRTWYFVRYFERIGAIARDELKGKVLFARKVAPKLDIDPAELLKVYRTIIPRVGHIHTPARFSLSGILLEGIRRLAKFILGRSAYYRLGRSEGRHT
jgi:hypothetical protein